MMRKQRAFRLRWIVLALVVGFAALYCVAALFKGRLDIIFTAGRVYQAVAMLLVAA